VLGSAENFGDIELALNMNSVDLLISFDRFSFNLDVRNQSGITADRTRSFKVGLRKRYMDGDEFPHEQVRAFARFVLDSCPELKKMLIEIALYAGDHIEPLAAEQFEPFVRRIKPLNDALKTELANLKSPECELIIAMAPRFPMQTLTDAIDGGHAVMEIGEHYDDNEWPVEWLGQDTISRQVKLGKKLTVRYYFVGVA